jgi:glycosyltransferase involved in cell wall biosynthesis
MRIGIITGEYPPMEGGVGDFTQQLGQTLATQGHEVYVLTGQDETSPISTEKKLTIHRQVRDWGWASHSQIMRWIKQIQPDVIDIQYQAAAYQLRGGICLFPRWQRRNLTIPVVTTFHDLRPPYLFPKAGEMREWAICQMAQYSGGIITTNDDDYTSLTTTLLDKEPKPQIRLIPIGSNIAPAPPGGYDRSNWRARHGFGEEELLLGFFGFLNRSKGVETLVKATAKLLKEGIPVRLIFIGGRTGSSDLTNVDYANEIDELIKEVGIADRVLHTGYSMPADVSAALLATDLCVLPYLDGASLRRGTLHACLTHGLAIITTTPKTPAPQLQDGKAMRLVPPENSDALAEVILDLWKHPDACAALRKNAAALAHEFSWDRIAAHTLEFFSSLAGKRP